MKREHRDFNETTPGDDHQPDEPTADVCREPVPLAGAVVAASGRMRRQQQAWPVSLAAETGDACKAHPLASSIRAARTCRKAERSETPRAAALVRVVKAPLQAGSCRRNSPLFDTSSCSSALSTLPAATISKATA